MQWEQVGLRRKMEDGRQKPEDRRGNKKFKVHGSKFLVKEREQGVVKRKRKKFQVPGS